MRGASREAPPFFARRPFLRSVGARVSLVLMATVAGMALGGWMQGADL